MAKAKKEENKKLKKEEINLNEIKEELSLYIDKEIKKSINEQLEKANKRIIKEKNKKIFLKNIIIILLTALILYLVYLLNTVNYFDEILKFGKKTTNTETSVVENTSNTKSFNELKTEYSKLLDNIYISEKSSYIKDYYNSNLTNELKLYLSLNIIDFNDLEKEDNYNILALNTLKTAYYKLFDSEIKNTNIDYNGNKINYLNKLESYITTSTLERTKSNIKKEIIDIKEDDSAIYITTIEGLINNNRIYNVLTNKEVGNGNDLVKYKNKLNKVTYTFKNNKLISL